MFFLWRKSEIAERKILLIGPSNAGKTSLLGALSIASDIKYQPDGGLACELQQLNQPMRELAALAQEAITTGHFPINATSTLTEYEFVVKLRNAGFCESIVEGDFRRSRFMVLDGPGGTLLPRYDAQHSNEVTMEFDAEFREVLLEKAARAEALVLCVDASDREQAATYFLSLSELLHTLGEPLPFQQIIILLAKADRLFESHGAAAESAIEQANPWLTAWDLLTEPVVRKLWSFADPKKTTLAAGWTSIYGFIPEEGYPNYDAEHNRVGTFRKGAHYSTWIHTWRPYQLLDPFIFLAGGGARSLWIHRGFRAAT